jgi:hypothetical protein
VVSGLQEGNEEDQRHAGNGGKKTETEKDPVTEPSCKKSAQDPGKDAAQVHEARAYGKVAALYSERQVLIRKVIRTAVPRPPANWSKPCTDATRTRFA